MKEIRQMGFSRSWLKRIKQVLYEVPTVISVNHPEDVTRGKYLEYVGYLAEQHKNSNYRRQKLSALNIFLARYENYVATSVKVRWGKPLPKNINWLSPMEMGQLWATEMDPVERFVVWLESRLGARGVELCRMKVDDFDLKAGNIILHGKGAMGGKDRRLKIPPSGYREIPAFQEYRENEIAKALNTNPNLDIPDQFIIWFNKNGSDRLVKLTDNSLYFIYLALSKRSGVSFTGHDLRRTYGRHLYQCNVKLPTIQKILGHNSIDQTIHYLGINDDDVEEGILAGEGKLLCGDVENECR